MAPEKLRRQARKKLPWQTPKTIGAGERQARLARFNAKKLGGTHLGRKTPASQNTGVTKQIGAAESRHYSSGMAPIPLWLPACYGYLILAPSCADLFLKQPNYGPHVYS
jgi:hypothetical protein